MDVEFEAEPDADMLERLGEYACRLRRERRLLEWQEEARVEQYREVLLQALELRFGAPVPADLAAAIKVQEGLQELKRWFVASQTAPSLDRFRAAVGQ